MAICPTPQPKPQQIHHAQFFSALRAEIIDIFDANVCLPSVILVPSSVIPAILFVIPAKAGIQTIRQLHYQTDIHNINLRFLKFPKTSLADFHVSRPN